MKKIDVWMPFYPGDYLADTTRLTTEQHGAYFLMLLDYWRSGALPDDDAVLAQITRLSPEGWQRHSATLRGFFDARDGKLYHHRVERELAAAKVNQERRSGKAKKAAAARWERGEPDASGNASSNAPSMLPAVHGECPSPSPSVTKVTGAEDAPAPDKKTEVWRRGKALLASANVPGKQQGGIVGSWRKDAGDDLLLTLIEEAADKAEPVSWMAAALKSRCGPDPLAALRRDAARIAHFDAQAADKVSAPPFNR